MQDAFLASLVYIESMGPFIFSMCQKPIVGLAMASAALCDFPSLIKDVHVKLDEAGTVVTTEVEVPVDLSYFLLLEMSNPAGDSLNKQEVAILGERRLEDCGDTSDLDKVPKKDRASYGRPMAFKVEVRHKPDNALVHSRLVNTLCVASKWANQRSRNLGNIALTRGSYSIRIENVAAQAGLENLSANLALMPAIERPLTAQR
ncbi:DUF5625 family protein [Pseudoduganella violaceinigra]|uniref:DUF5625 family protein n=1 Tax=Pseudoduganella violaceinigra TaxID=246602 RepID=UPI00040E5C31|nr:DUF5625 family protein [Pseudoduganella violaceinigra]